MRSSRQLHWGQLLISHRSLNSLHMVTIFIHCQPVLLELVSWKWRAPYPITPEQKKPVPLSDLKIHLYFMLTTFISECDASSDHFWGLFCISFPVTTFFFTKLFAVNSAISKWTGGCCYGGGRGSSAVCAFDDLTDMQTLILLEYAWQAVLMCVHCYYSCYYQFSGAESTRFIFWEFKAICYSVSAWNKRDKGQKRLNLPGKISLVFSAT